MLNQYKIIFPIFIILFLNIHFVYSYENKIIAIVSDEAVTTRDLENFKIINCFIHKDKLKEICQDDRYIDYFKSMLIEIKLKEIYFKKIELNLQNDKNYNDYLNEIIQKTKFNKKIAKKLNVDWDFFLMYNDIEYKWNMILSSYVVKMIFSKEEINNIMKIQKINKNDAIIFLKTQKMKSKSEELSRDFKKYFFVEMR